jgi:hypothetical protein
LKLFFVIYPQKQIPLETISNNFNCRQADNTINPFLILSQHDTHSYISPQLYQVSIMDNIEHTKFDKGRVWISSYPGMIQKVQVTRRWKDKKSFMSAHWPYFNTSIVMSNRSALVHCHPPRRSLSRQLLREIFLEDGDSVVILLAIGCGLCISCGYSLPSYILRLLHQTECITW